MELNKELEEKIVNDIKEKSGNNNEGQAWIKLSDYDLPTDSVSTKKFLEYLLSFDFIETGKIEGRNLLSVFIKQ